MGKMSDLLIDVQEQLTQGVSPLLISDRTGLPLEDVLHIERDMGLDFSDADYENHRRFQMMVDSLMNPPCLQDQA